VVLSGHVILDRAAEAGSDQAVAHTITTLGFGQLFGAQLNPQVTARPALTLSKVLTGCVPEDMTSSR
jgi:hypothetical protein